MATKPQAPACRLPPELLETIFVYYAAYYGSTVGYLQVPSWVNVSYVCRHWRKVALDCPTLWAHHFVASLRWSEELLARSKQAPLTISIKFIILRPQDWWLRHVEMLMNHSERLQNVRLCLSEGLVPAFSTGACAPRLQNLRISAVDDRFRCTSVPFGGDTPALRTLELSRCWVPWNLFKLSCLTVFDLSYVSDDGRPERDMEELLAALRVMKDLRYLYLDHALSGAAGFLSSTASSTFQKIDLPHLSRLLIIAPALSVVALLSCVNIPSKTVVKINCDYEHDTDHARLCSALEQSYRGSEDRALPIRSLSILKYRSTKAMLTFGGSEQICEYEPFDWWEADIRLAIVVNWEDTVMEVGVDCITRDICRAVPLENVKTLHVETLPLSSAHWREILERLPDLCCIRLKSVSMPDLASVLIYEDQEDRGGHAVTEGRANCRLVPCLEELELNKVMFSTEEDSSRWSHVTITQRRLLDALSTRHNAPHGRLTMVDCKIDGVWASDVVRSWDDVGG